MWVQLPLRSETYANKQLQKRISVDAYMSRGWRIMNEMRTRSVGLCIISNMIPHSRRQSRRTSSRLVKFAFNGQMSQSSSYLNALSILKLALDSTEWNRSLSTRPHIILYFLAYIRFFPDWEAVFHKPRLDSSSQTCNHRSITIGSMMFSLTKHSRSRVEAAYARQNASAR